MLNYLPLLLIPAISLVILLGSVIIHELAHAYTADRLGDPTPRIDGRLTLNPLAHLEWFGSVILPLSLSLIGSPFIFGWAKPVVFDPYNLAKPRRDTALISLAGPLSNIVLATIVAIFARLVAVDSLIYLILAAVVRLNITLAVFNLIPIHPLDGGKILVGLLPQRDAYKVDLFLRRYGTYLLLLLILPIWRGSSPVFAITTPVIKLLSNLLLPNYYQFI